MNVSVILAATDAIGTITESLAGFLDEVAGRGEVVLVDASRDGTADAAEARFPGRVRLLRRPPGMLAPALWGAGIDATEAPLIALSTAAMVPGPGWLDRLGARLDATGAAAVGGPIEPAAGLSAFDRAVFLHRYATYLPPVPDHDRPEPPGDNVLYRRDRLAGLEPSWADGFWEAEVHRRLRDRGEILAMTPEAIVTYRGGCLPGATLRRRLDHARHYGAGRFGGRGLAPRLARSAAAPAVPALLLARIVRTLRARGWPLSPWLSAVPSLLALLTAWAAGEAAGTALGGSWGSAFDPVMVGGKSAPITRRKGATHRADRTDPLATSPPLRPPLGTRRRGPGPRPDRRDDGVRPGEQA